MSERLLPGDFDKLTHAIWDLARLTMYDELQICPEYSLVKGQVEFEDICLEPEVYVSHCGRMAVEEMPREIALTVNHKDKYALDESFVIYAFKRLHLNTKTRRKTVTTGTVLLQDETGYTITPQTVSLREPSELAPGQKRKWSGIKSGPLSGFSHGDAEYFLGLVDRAIFLHTYEN